MNERNIRVSTGFWKVEGTHRVTGFREQRQLHPKAPQMETPKKSKPAAPRNQETLRGWGIEYYGRQGRDGAWRKACLADSLWNRFQDFQKTNGFLFDIYFLPSPWHVCPFSFLKECWILLVWWCGLEIQRNACVQSLGNMKLTQVSRGSRLREQSVQTGTQGQQTLLMWVL